MNAPPALREREKDVERRCDSLMAQLGWVIIRFSQPRNTMQTPGIPDRRYYHRDRGVALWFECKRPGGKQSPHQRLFQDIAEACGEWYVLGGVDELAAAATQLIRGGVDSRACGSSASAARAMGNGRP